jgi:capsular exopolysaccharide synthesis family protein
MNLRTLVITSSVPGEGKTITALNLSMSFAKILESSVILVEADLHRPALQAYLKYEEPMKGLADYLLDDVPVGELLVNPGIPKLEILFAGRTIPDSTELLASNKMKDLVKDLTYQNKNTYVIFDMTSLLEFPDALVSLEFVDAVLMVVAAEATSLDRIIEAHEKIGDKTFLGFVLNKARIDEGHLKRKV